MRAFTCTRKTVFEFVRDDFRKKKKKITNMGNHNSFNLNHKEQMHAARINSHTKDPTLGMLPMEKLGKVRQTSRVNHLSVYLPGYRRSVVFVCVPRQLDVPYVPSRITVSVFVDLIP